MTNETTTNWDNVWMRAEERVDEGTLSDTAFGIIEDLLDQVDEDTTVDDMLDALCDGEMLDRLGWGDQTAIEEAYGFFEGYVS